MNDNLNKSKSIKPLFDRKKFAQELKKHRASMKMGASVMDEVRSEAKFIQTGSIKVKPPK